VDAVVVVGAGMVVVVVGASLDRAPARVACGCPAFGDALNATTATAAVSAVRRRHEPMLATRAGHQCVGSVLRDKGSSLADTPRQDHDTPGCLLGEFAIRRPEAHGDGLARSSEEVA